MPAASHNPETITSSDRAHRFAITEPTPSHTFSAATAASTTTDGSVAARLAVAVGAARAPAGSISSAGTSSAHATPNSTTSRPNPLSPAPRSLKAGAT